MSKKYIVANWKMQPESLAEAEQILDSVNDYLESMGEKELSLVFCPPFVFIEEVGKILRTSHLEHQSELGAQDIFWDDQGADTGEVSGPMLSKLGVGYVIIGHSERRWKLGESDKIVNKKLKAALRNELIPIVCVGERVRDDPFDKTQGHPERSRTGDNFKEFLKNQVSATFAGLSADEVGKCLIAYEPVWAISSNPNARPDTPESALESIKIIKDTLLGNCPDFVEDPRYNREKLEIGNLPKVLYGGSVTSSNVASFLKEKEISGVLVGGASVNKEEFVGILKAV